MFGEDDYVTKYAAVGKRVAKRELTNADPGNC